MRSPPTLPSPRNLKRAHSTEPTLYGMNTLAFRSDYDFLTVFKLQTVLSLSGVYRLANTLF